MPVFDPSPSVGGAFRPSEDYTVTGAWDFRGPVRFSGQGQALNVRAFGAKGDGRTNDTRAFEEAEQALPATGGTIFVPEGTYLVAYRVRKAKVTIQGASWGAVLKTQPNAVVLQTDCPLRLMANYCHVRDLAIDGNRPNNAHLESMALAQYADGIGIYANYCSVERVYTRDVLGHHIIAWNHAFAGENVTNQARTGISVRHCLITEIGLRNALDYASLEGLGAGFDQNICHTNEMVGNILLGGTLMIHTGYDTVADRNIILNGSCNLHTASKRVRFTNNYIYGGDIQITGGLDTTKSETARRSSDCLVRGNIVVNAPFSGIALTAVDRCTVEHNRIVSPTKNGVTMDLCNDIDIVNNRITDALEHGINQSTSDLMERIRIAHNWVTCTLYGTSMGNAYEVGIEGNTFIGGTQGVAATTATGRRYWIANNRILNTSNHGIDCYVQDSEIRGNLLQTIGGSGIEPGASGITIHGNRIRGSVRGVNIRNSATGIAVTSNRFSGQSSTVVQNIQADTVVSGNIGFVTEANGTATVANGATTATVTHGLARTPAVKDITLTPTNNLGNATKYWVSGPTSTQFTVNVNADPGAGTATFAWSAEVRP